MLTSNTTVHCFFILQAGERGEFTLDRPVSDKLTGQTLTGNNFVGELHHANKALVPQSMDRWCTPGPLFTHFLTGTRAPAEPMAYLPSTPWAAAMNKRACSSDVPYGILHTASKNWLYNNPMDGTATPTSTPTPRRGHLANLAWDAHSPSRTTSTPPATESPTSRRSPTTKNAGRNPTPA